MSGDERITTADKLTSKGMLVRHDPQGFHVPVEVCIDVTNCITPEYLPGQEKEQGVWHANGLEL